MQQPGEQSDVPFRRIPPKPRRQRRLRRWSFGSRAASRVYELQPREEMQQNALQTRVTRITDLDRAYFDCYAHIGVHEEMIKDRVRTDAYKNAIMHHKDFIKNKVVLDVGCGTGILSIFCAQAGAKRVYAVEASSIALQDAEIKEKVDVIISEWMGYMLVYESMLGSVITARDRWLKPGGLILPSNARLYMAPFTHTKRYHESVDFWRNVYGIDMSALLPLAKQGEFEEPSVETITGENVLTSPRTVKYVNCYSITIPELKCITTRFKFNSLVKAPLHGFAFWFEVEFDSPAPVLSPMPINFLLPASSVDNDPVDGSQGEKCRNRKLLLSTAPEDPPTHWQQTLIYFYDPIELEQDQLIEGMVALSQSQEHARFINIHLEYTSEGRSHVKETTMR
ncbi:probable protein arginine N-methyltransferase 6 isoform X2 [Abrus precatorius]|uniref:Probable protein arginine N-methyltransferase 6 isoform X2 n=1 Tax=Abrus precatorius TaxID=3816 RepID=A0A8B8MEG9_ABRPR|nr:probable protein arginine N-methyltransferase 6 isoform X2 [Abrus precatorius]